MKKRKKPAIYVIDGDISITTTEIIAILLQYHSQRWFVFFFPGVLFFFFFSFWKHLIHYIYLLAVFISAEVSGNMSLCICRKRHRILIFWPHNKLKCVKSLHFQSKADLIVVKCYLFYFRWENYSLSLLTLIWTVILSPPSNSTSAHEELCIISMELLLEEGNLHRIKSIIIWSPLLNSGNSSWTRSDQITSQNGEHLPFLFLFYIRQISIWYQI